MAFAVLLGPTCIDVFLTPLGGIPIRWHGLLIRDFFVLFADVLLGRWHQGGVNQLAASGDKALAQQLRGHPFKQGLCSGTADAVLEGPDGGAIWDVADLSKAAKFLVAQSVQQLKFHLLI